MLSLEVIRFFSSTLKQYLRHVRFHYLSSSVQTKTKSLQRVNFTLKFNHLIFAAFIIIIISFWIRCCSRQLSWPDFLWSLSLPRFSILFHHMHTVSPIHFSSLHSLLVFFHVFLVFSSSTTTQFKLQCHHYYIFIFFPQNMTVPPHTTCFNHPFQRLLYTFIIDKYRYVGIS